MRRRPGFASLSGALSTYRVRVVDFRRYDGTAVLPANELRSFDLTTAALADLFSTTSKRLYVGLAHRDPRIRVQVGVVNAVSSVLSMSYWNGAAWTALTVTDGTASAGKTMAQSGDVTAAEPARGLWVRGGMAEASFGLDADLFWLELKVSVGLTAGASLAAIHALPPAAFFVRGIHGFDIPGRASRAVLEWFDREYLETRYFGWDAMGNWIEALALKDSARDYGDDPCGSGVRFGGHLVIPAPSGRTLFWDGVEPFVRRVEALPGEDAREDVDGQDTYLAAAPLGLYVENWQDRLVVAHDPKMDPLQFALSVPNAAFAVIPSDARLGGGSLWRLRDVYHVPSRSGDRIQGIVGLGDLLALLCLDDLWVFDLASLKPLNAGVGCLAPRSVQKAGNRVFYLGDHALFAFDGGGIVRVDGNGELSRTWDLVAWQSVETDAFAVVDQASHEYRLFLPIRGEIRGAGAFLVVVVDTGSGYICKDAAAPPWDDSDWHSVSPRPFGSAGTGIFTAAGVVREAGDETRTIVADTSGRLYRYGLHSRDGESTGPNPFAYALFGALQQPQRVIDFRDVEVEARQDGGPVEVHLLRDGQSHEQAITSNLAGYPKSAAGVKTADGADGQVGDKLVLWATAAWGQEPKEAFYDRMKFSFREHARKARLLLWLPGGTRATLSGPTWTSPNDARGGVRGLTPHVNVLKGER